MAAYTAGQTFLRGYQYEAVYGTMQTSTLKWGGEVQKYKPTNNYKNNFNIFPGSRAFGSVDQDPYEIGFTCELISRAAAEWVDFFAYYGMGASTGTDDVLPAFTALFDVYDGTTHAYHCYSGCKINKLEIEGTAPGRELIFRIEVFAQFFDDTASKTQAKIQAVTIGADASTPGGAALCWTSNLTINIAAGGAATIYPEKFKFTINNHLTRENGIKTGADTNNYPVAVALHEGIREIIFEADLIAQNQTYNTAKQINSVITALTIPIDDETMTLSTGYFTRDDFPEHVQDNFREPIKALFKTLAIA